MRTTIDIADELLRKAKTKAADEQKSLRDIVEAALRSYLDPRPPSTKYKLQWGSTKGELLPGVDIDDRDSLFDIMDGLK